MFYYKTYYYTIFLLLYYYGLLCFIVNDPTNLHTDLFFALNIIIIFLIMKRVVGLQKSVFGTELYSS